MLAQFGEISQVPVFISYSHADSESVDRIAAAIVANRGSVWIDRWELNVGDSIIQKIQDAIEESSALLVVLSKASVSSEWCKKEINAGLIRELEEKKVIVLPVLLEDCKIPVFLRDKLYADFRRDYSKGLTAILEAVAAVTNLDQNRIEGDDFFADWSVDWSFNENKNLVLRYTIAESSKTEPMSIVTEVVVACNEPATERYKLFVDAGLDWFGRISIAQALIEYAELHELHIVLDSQHEQSFTITIADAKSDSRYVVTLASRRLGVDSGKSQVVRISGYLRNIVDFVNSSARKLSKSEERVLLELILSNMKRQKP